MLRIIKMFIATISTPISRGKMRCLLGALVVFVVLDGILTEYLLRNGLAREGNPFLEPLVGDIGFMMLKVAGSMLCAFILWDIYRRFPRVAVAATWCCTAAYAVIVVWNTSVFLIS
jgi:hypothetical protein